ncbi:MAG TPA: methionine--tRNA ligase subunit beta, partial [Lachnospiraceae bacterium]|nr:methionine--tRNA ligase subunit beta [Lachnospiraceae bacterium]
MLMALGLPLPKQVFGHPWLLQSDGKMSKSRGNVLYADDMVDLFGVDAVRYFLLHEMPFENDGVVSWELMIERVNSDLANTLGNLVNRTISMSNKYFNGVVTRTGVVEEVDDDLKRVVGDTRLRVNICMDKLRVADAMTEIWNLFKRCNKYIDETMPWVLAKEEGKQPRLNEVLYNLVESITIGASLLESFLPETSERILKQLNTEKRSVTELGQFGLYPTGNKVTDDPEILFARIDMKEMLDEIEKRFPSVKEEETEAKKEAEKKKEAAKKEAERKEPAKVEAVQKALLSIDDFDKMQLQIGEVMSCEEVPNSKKLLCSQVKVAGRTLQIVSGIKSYYMPEDMVGKKVVVITNLKPAKLAGIVSEGMLLCAEDDEGRLALLTADKDIPAGSMIS